ncbi:uncharacterized protein AMSG_00872 [Thecamonas trahens ATCC 50062]|uniref:Uncharacterized protein n=1 Tax=Thecamonas trahens ATCC 50062 TaxID=461836 RepID=A0A0L0DII6_THETB|nr:hypothetical protein AMSG_00872 [Thecamonas trahens ATCC 50062]KNC52045.1 hypothetical protein AMSG_00872 [Thecamonas trahens ATCC 50062]|eukprot:XP_013762051.1 hypothetical protein AMSG_00872 [Thecamonas trahens ATCC 50062]
MMLHTPEPEKRKWAVVETSYFRGGWSPYLPSPSKPKPKPKVADATPLVAESADDRPPPIAIPVEPVVVETASGQLLTGPPDDVDVLISVYDRYREFRAYIAADGEVTSNAGQVLGYINIDEYEVGSADMEFLGYGKAGIDETRFEVFDSNDVELVEVNLGTAVIKERGSTVCEIDGTGGCTGNDGSFLGEFEGFGYAHMRTIALYLCILDTGMLNCVEG